MAAILAALAWSRANWRLAAAGLALLALLLAGWWLYAAGRDHERAAQDRASLDALRNRSHIDETLARETDINLCHRLGGGAYCSSLSVQPDVRRAAPGAPGAGVGGVAGDQ